MKNNLTNTDIEKMLLKETQSITPNVLNEIKLKEKELKNEEIKNLENVQEENNSFFKNLNWKKIFSPAKLAISFVIILVLVFSITSITVYGSEVETVCIDVNPSIELTINKFDRVIKVTCNNEDATELLDNVNLKNKKIDEALTTCYESLFEEGYFADESSNMIVISTYSNEDEEKIDDERVSNYISIIASANEKHSITCLVLENSTTKELKETASENNLSLGQIKVIEEIFEIDPDCDFNELKTHKMKELKEIYTDLLEKYLSDLNPDSKENEPGKENSEEKTEEKTDDKSEKQEDSYDSLYDLYQKQKEEYEKKMEEAEESIEEQVKEAYEEFLNYLDKYKKDSKDDDSKDDSSKDDNKNNNKSGKGNH